MAQIASNLTNGARMSVSLNGGIYRYFIGIPAIPGGANSASLTGSSIAEVLAEMDRYIAIFQRRLANGPFSDTVTQAGLNQSIATYTALKSQFSSKATADEATLRSQEVVTTPPAPPPPPPPLPPPVTAPAPVSTPTPATPGGSNIVVDKPPITTNPSKLLPLGDAIDDIYDPNLTPEQIASLSPGDRQARADTLADEAAGAVDPNTFDQEIVVTGARQQQQAFQAGNDWRVRLALSDDPGVNYLYKAPDPGILKPLNKTNGVIFPYTPTISVNYAANYNPTELVHSNYKVFQYSSSSIDSVTIMSDFTAQDEYEANYLLAVIHFFRSATKMFYGQDQNPRKGTPPPLCYIYGMGSHQFAGHPLAIQSFSYNLPNNVDYIKTSAGGDTASATTQPSRMAGTGAAPGGVLPPPNFTPTVSPDNVSWIPSKIQLSITCVPMMNRNAVSNEFSFEKYATGTLLNGVRSRSGGFW
jgi:hypothetical protein